MQINDQLFEKIGIGISISAVLLLLLIFAFGYFLSKLKAKTKAERKPEKFIRHRPSPLQLDEVRVRRLQSQLTPQPLVITPTTPNQFTIPSRRYSEDHDKSINAFMALPEGDALNLTSPDSRLPDNVILKRPVKLSRAMSEGYGYKERCLTPHGRIECFLKHDDEKNCLLVQILGKKGHSLSWLTGVSNPYIRVTLISSNHKESDQGVSSQILDLPSNPKCQLEGISKEDVKTCLLKFVVLDFDRFSRSEFVAEALVSLGDLENLSDGITVCEDLIPQQKLMLAPRGSLLISLCNQSVAQQLQVIILKADGIPSKGAVSLTGSDICVKATLETSQVCYARKCKAPRKNTNYVFNEKLVFDVSSEDLTNASLVFEVSRGDSKLLIDTKIGLVKLGLHSNQALEIRHWSEMLASPQKQIAEWHQIRR